MRKIGIVFLIIITLGFFAVVLYAKRSSDEEDEESSSSGGGSGGGGGTGYYPGYQKLCFNFEMLAENGSDEEKFGNYSKLYAALDYPYNVDNGKHKKFIILDYWLCRKKAYGVNPYVYFRNRFTVIWKLDECGKRQIKSEMKKIMQGLSEAYVIYTDSPHTYPYGICDENINYAFVRGNKD